MKSVLLIILSITCLFHFAVSQEKSSDLPYYEIPAYPESYTAGSVAARVVDGLGFRYYWATEGLRPEDLAYKPTAEARTTEETLVHIYNLTLVLANATRKIATVTGGEQPRLSLAELRKGTLENIKTASDILKRSSEKDLQTYNMKFTGTRTADFPFWNLLNGPIDDALWHVGQVITFRRSSGNPFNGNANVLIGKFVEQKNAPVSKE